MYVYSKGPLLLISLRLLQSVLRYSMSLNQRQAAAISSQETKFLRSLLKKTYLVVDKVSPSVILHRSHYLNHLPYSGKLLRGENFCESMKYKISQRTFVDSPQTGYYGQ